MAAKAKHKRSIKRKQRNGKRSMAKMLRAHQRARRKSVAPRTLRQFSAIAPRSQDRWNRITQAVSKMRTDKVSLTQAAKEFRITPRILARSAKPALRKRRNGRYVARPMDKLLRVLTLPTPQGLREVAVRDSRQASRLGQYWAAVRKYLQTGDASALAKFRGKRITDASRRRIPLITDLEELNRLGSAGVLSFESLYAGIA